MSAICQRFVQNAWRSDLCSNCFKCLEDHQSASDGGGHRATSVQRYMSQAAPLYQSRSSLLGSGTPWRSTLGQPCAYDRAPSCRDSAARTGRGAAGRTAEWPDVERQRGILKEASPLKGVRRRSSVGFSSEEALVIGYGGNDYDSDDSFELASDDGSIDMEQLDVTEEDRTVTRLTKDNTEFNSFNKNLLESAKQAKIDTHNNINNKLKNTDENMIGYVAYNKEVLSRSPEKKTIGQYYFSTREEPLKCHLYGNNPHVVKSYNSTNNSNEEVIACHRKPDVIMSLKMESINLNSSPEHCKMIFGEDYTPLNTTTYSFVSKISQKSNSLDQSSDSDYSTSRQTNGESTDSESFPDSDEVRAAPCQSLLYGAAKQNSRNAVKNGGVDFKPYDAGSSTSGDVSNFSDDSDSQTPPEIVPNAPSAKILPSAVTVNYKDNRTNSCKSDINTKVNNSRLINSPQNPSLLNNANNRASNVTVNCSVAKMSNCDIDKAPVKEYAKLNINLSEVKSTEECIRSKVTSSGENSRKECVGKDKSSGLLSSSNTSSNPTMKEVHFEIINAQKMPDGKPRRSSDGNTKPAVKDSDIEVGRRKSCNTESGRKSEINNCAATDSKKAEIPRIADDNKPTINTPPRTEGVSKPQLRTTDSEGGRKETPNATASESGRNATPKTPDIAEDGSSENKTTSSAPDTDHPGTEDSSPGRPAEDKSDRQSKLAALALELERARCDTDPEPAVTAAPIISHLHPARTPTATTARTAEPYSTIRRNSGIPSTAKLIPQSGPVSPLPDVLQDTKPKKSRFSLKKLLKRGSKDYESPPGIAPHPKAWKKHTFDRSRLSLDIVHPMELVSSPETTPTEEKTRFDIFADPKGRARSLSALPYLGGDESHARKAGTVAERKKKNRPQLVRTPSCSALHSRPSVPQRPPKPPPPPRVANISAQAPPPPQSRIAKLANSPARPPPPRIPESHTNIYSPSDALTSELHTQCKMERGEYANLGDIRSLLTPKKPVRPSALSFAREGETGTAVSPEDTYETLEAAIEEEDHYTYLDDAEMKCSKVEVIPDLEEIIVTTSQPDDTGFVAPPPWLDLQASYSAIAAAMYESLTDLTTTTLHEDMECFQKVASSLKWKDFYLESEKPEQVIEDKRIFNALHKNLPQIKVTLVVTAQRHAATTATQTTRKLTRLPILGSFSDQLPSHFLPPTKATSSFSGIAYVYVLQRSRVTTLDGFARDNAFRCQMHQHIRLRDDCFVLLQLIQLLKGLQADGVEEVVSGVGQVVLLQTTDGQKPPMLTLLPGDKLHLLSTTHQTQQNSQPLWTLCHTTLQTLLQLLQTKAISDIHSCQVNNAPLAPPVAHTFAAIARVLSEEKASSLSQAKGLLEHMLWGPVDVAVDPDCSSHVDEILKRWLDLQRAQMVKSLVTHLNSKSKVGLHVYEEYQLVFLMQASVKSLKDVIAKL